MRAKPAIARDVGSPGPRLWHPIAATVGALRRPGFARGLLVACLLLPAGVAFAQSAAQRFPDVVAARVRAAGPDLFDFDVTVSSPHDTPNRYADAFRVAGADGQVFAERKLLHDHQHEQPFTRDLHAVAIPPGVKKVVVQARDRKHGYGGATVEVTLPGR